MEVRPVCINASRWDCTLEPTRNPGQLAVRLGFRQVRPLSNTDAAAIVLARAELPFRSVDEVWRRSSIPSASLVKIAEADGFAPSLKLARRDALWAIKALRDEPLPLFAAGSPREQGIAPEVIEESVALKPMTAGREVVEDYGHMGLSLRAHPVSFLRKDRQSQGYVDCAGAGAARDGETLMAAGVVLVRQKPGSAKGVMFITIEDETGVSNLVIWTTIYKKQRRIILTAAMLGVQGRIQREGAVVHLVAQQLFDLLSTLARLGGREAAFSLPHGRGDEFARGPSTPDPKDASPGPRARDIYISDLHLDRLKLKTRDFR